MVLSADSEGTQSAAVGDSLILDSSYPASSHTVYNVYSKDCKTRSLLPPTDITRIFTTQNQGINNLTFRYADWCGGKKQISSLYLVNLEDNPAPTPTPSPSPSSSPSPSPSPTPIPAPFLDLPWDYQSKNLSFELAALNPGSWFDHKYPLQNYQCCIKQVTKYTGEIRDYFYKSHNGYDYNIQNGVVLNTEVLASAFGYATYVSEDHSSGAGNVIKIDHGNGYQTWYEHLQKDGLIVSVEGQKIFVNKGQVIGKVGMTGNTSGPHIHFSVFKDINGNGNFDDDLPFGATDPLGWEGENPDPWPADKNGAESHNLFIERAAPVQNLIPITGGDLNSEGTQIVVPQGASDNAFNLIFKNGPFETLSDLVKSVSPSFFLNAYSGIGIPITEFSNPIKIIYNYSNSDLSNIKEDTLKLYYFNEHNATWNAIPTIIDSINKTATGETLHFSQFALMGELKDTTAPSTEAEITGEKGQENWYRSNVTIELKGRDDIQGLGLQYTLYTLNGSDWFEYNQPLVIESEGNHTITFQSFDKADNRDERKTIEFNIDKTIPEANVYIDPNLPDLAIKGIDQNPTTIEKLENTQTKKKTDSIYLVSDQAGNSIKLDVRDIDLENKDKFSVFSITYNKDLPIELAKNQFNAIYKEENGQKYIKEAKFTLKGVEKIKIDYDFAKNECKVITKEYGQNKVKEILQGGILLQLVTNKGNLEYSYQ